MQTYLLAEYPTVNVIPSEKEPIALGPAEQICDECSYTDWWTSKPIQVSTTPMYHEITETWYMPCHEVLCSDCADVVNVKSDAYHYNQNDNLVCDDCYVRPRCDCGDCHECTIRLSRNAIEPRWSCDGLSIESNNAGYRFSRNVMNEAKVTNPVAMMAEFYICEYVIAHTQRSYRFGFNPHNPAMRSDWAMRSDAKRYQDYIVATLDPIFRDYILCAIGGEARHHPKANMPGGRDSAWDWFVGMALEHGRVYMIESAIELFDDDIWSASYGGPKWAAIARTLLDRETGVLDAKTFVDRVFSLQHNGGSVLTKFCWNTSHGVDNMTMIGNFHHGSKRDGITCFGGLLSFCNAQFVSDLFFQTVNGQPRSLSTFAMSATERRLWNMAMQWAEFKLVYPQISIGNAQCDVLPEIDHELLNGRADYWQYDTWAEWYKQ